MDDKADTVKLVIRVDDKSSMCQDRRVDIDNDYPQRFAESLVSEIKAEMGRQGLSSRALSRLMGVNAQFVSSRLDGGNPRTGERVTLSVRDLAAIAIALRLTELDLVERAKDAMRRNNLRALTFDDIDHEEVSNLDDYDLAAKRGTRKADDLPYAE